MREVMGETMHALDRAAREDNVKAMDVLRKSGIQTVAVKAADVETWRSTVEGIYPELRKRPDINAAFLDDLLAALATYRKSHDTAAGVN